MSKHATLGQAAAQYARWRDLAEATAKLSDEELKPLLEAMDAEAWAALQMMAPERLRRLGFEVVQDEIIVYKTSAVGNSVPVAASHNIPRDPDAPPWAGPMKRYSKD